MVCMRTCKFGTRYSKVVRVVMVSLDVACDATAPHIFYFSIEATLEEIEGDDVMVILMDFMSIFYVSQIAENV